MNIDSLAKRLENYECDGQLTIEDIFDISIDNNCKSSDDIDKAKDLCYNKTKTIKGV